MDSKQSNLMKKIIFSLLFLFCFIPGICLADSICYYIPYEINNGWDLPLNDCRAFEKLAKSLGETSVETITINYLSTEEASKYDIVYISSYGTPEGLITKITNEEQTIIPWSDIAKINTPLLLIDTCFSGCIFDYNCKSDIVITSAGKTPSWNISVDEENLSSFIVMLRCIFDYEYDCPIHIKQCCKINSVFTPDPEACQFNLIVQKLFREVPGIFGIYNHQEPLSLSTAYVNGEPWR